MSVKIQDRRPETAKVALVNAQSGRRKIIGPEQVFKCAERIADMLIEGGRNNIKSKLGTDTAPASYRRVAREIAPAGQVLNNIINKDVTEEMYVASIIKAATEIHATEVRNQYDCGWAIENVEVYRSTSPGLYQVPDAYQNASAIGISAPIGDKRMVVIGNGNGDDVLGTSRDKARVETEDQETIHYVLHFVALADVPEIIRVDGETRRQEQFASAQRQGASARELVDAIREGFGGAAKESGDAGAPLHHKTKEKYEKELAELRAQLAAQGGGK
jgi:hypothetical protein